MMYSRWTTVEVYIGILVICGSLYFCYAEDLTCNSNNVGEVDSTVILKCTFPGPTSINYFKSLNGDRIAYCLVGGKCNSTVSRYYITWINTNTTHLNITSVQVSDGGVWRCRDVNTEKQETCTLEVTKTPSCDISSDRNTSELELNEEITLTVNITDYYCSRPFDFLLQTSNTTEVLEKILPGNAVQSIMTNSTFKMSESHNGSLELIFGCHNQRIPCSGVQTLIMRPLPTCNITSDRKSSGLKIGDKITLHVYIEGYQCSSNSGYLLYTGDVMNTLNQSDSGMYEGDITLALTSSHFGPIYVGFTCNGASRNITAAGVTSLDEREPTTILTTISTTTVCPPQQEPNIAVIIGVTIAAVAFIITVSLIIWHMVTRRRKSSKPSTMGNESCPYYEVADSVHTRPKSMRPDNGAYADITEINIAFEKDSTGSKRDIHMVPNEVYDTGKGPYKSGLPDSKQVTETPEPVYTQVKKRSSTLSANGEC